MKNWNYAKRFRREFDLWDEDWEEEGPPEEEECEEDDYDDYIDWDSEDD